MLHHMLKEHGEPYPANVRRSSVVAARPRRHRMHPHLLRNFSSASEANKFPNPFAPSVPLRAAHKTSIASWALSVYTGSQGSSGVRMDKKQLSYPMGRQHPPQPPQSLCESALWWHSLRGWHEATGPCSSGSFEARLEVKYLFGQKTAWSKHFGNGPVTQLRWKG